MLEDLRPLARRLVALAMVAAFAVAPPISATGGPPTTPFPILFVTQFPIAADFATIGSTFANHRAGTNRVGRGGDLYIRYPDGTLRNLTAEAGYGSTGIHQGTDAIAVRDPHVHWSGTRALFSMAVGAPPAQFVWTDETWQLYEVTGLGPGDPISITLVPNQPEGYDNITPVYGSDGRIVFTSNRPRNGAVHLHPQLDEYESTATNTGLWSLDPATGDLRLLQHAPSGSFTPIVDSYGRVIFTRWDHLQRDQQADADALAEQQGNPAPNGTFNYSDETVGATALPVRDELFPEPRAARTDLLAGMTVQGHQVRGFAINHFFPWQINQDGSAEETLLHVGRHDLHDYFDRSLDGDPNIIEFIDSVSGRNNPNPIRNMFQLEEDPTVAGRFWGVDAPEFSTHASGQVVAVDGQPALPPDEIIVDYVTHRDTVTVVEDGDPVPPDHSGHYRDPLPLTDGQLVAAHTPETRAAGNDGTRSEPDPRYDFRLRTLELAANGSMEAAVALTAGIVKEVTYWDPDVLVHYDGPFWELSPVEVKPRPMPPLTAESSLEPPEAQIFAEEGVDELQLRAQLAADGLALIVSRNVTTRDSDDRQQPFNLSVPGGVTTTGTGGEIYDLAHLQILQGDLIRGMGGAGDPSPGRRVLAQLLHDPAVDNPPNPGGPPSSVAVALDGSVAAFVPAHRAMAWQLTSDDGTPVIRERYWISFQPGEIRLCTSCHGLSSTDQAGGDDPQNPPEALRVLLRHWLESQPIFSDGFETGDMSRWSATQP